MVDYRIHAATQANIWFQETSLLRDGLHYCFSGFIASALQYHAYTLKKWGMARFHMRSISGTLALVIRSGYQSTKKTLYDQLQNPTTDGEWLTNHLKVLVVLRPLAKTITFCWHHVVFWSSFTHRAPTHTHTCREIANTTQKRTLERRRYHKLFLHMNLTDFLCKILN